MRTLCLVTLIAACATLSFGQLPGPDPRIRQLVSAISADSLRATIERLASFGTRHTLSDTTSPTRGIGAARRWIAAELSRYAASTGGRMRVIIDRFTAEPSARIPQPTVLVDLAAILSGDDASAHSGEEMILISAHYDSRADQALDARSDAPGANDDGSGTALVLELARVMSTHSFRATVGFLCFAGEEQGLVGASHWAAGAAGRGDRIVALLNCDMVGNITRSSGHVESTFVRVFAEALTPADTGSVLARRVALGLENDGRSRSLARYVKEIGERAVPGFGVQLIYRRDRFGRGGDQTPFHQRGFAAVRITEAAENLTRQHHLPRAVHGVETGDLPRFVSASYCRKIACVVGAAAASLASAPPAPAHLSAAADSTGETTLLSWTPALGSAPTGYLVRWRATSTPVWEQARFTPDTSLVVPVSRDDYLFGVQAVSRSGGPSLVRTLLP